MFDNRKAWMKFFNRFQDVEEYIIDMAELWGEYTNNPSCQFVDTIETIDDEEIILTGEEYSTSADHIEHRVNIPTQFIYDEDYRDHVKSNMTQHLT